MKELKGIDIYVLIFQFIYVIYLCTYYLTWRNYVRYRLFTY